MHYIKSNFYLWVMIIIVLGVSVFSFYFLRTKPALWTDEAITVEISRGFLSSGKLDVQVAPGEFYNMPYLLQSTGYPITLSLALIFKIFGFGLTQARVYMVIWMVIALIVLFLFLKKLFGPREALLSCLLIATFSSFHVNGRTAVGDIPGFVFLILGFYILLFRNSYFWTGLLWGLAVVSKPSIYSAVIPVIFIVFLLERKDFLKKIFKIGIGMIPAALAWIFLVLGKDKLLTKAPWTGIINFYNNPFDSGSITENMLRNFLAIPHSNTLIYFGVLFLLIIFCRILVREEKPKIFYNFIIIYSFFIFIYYLRSPGWLKYILAAELLILSVLPETFHLIADRYKLKISWVGVILFLVLVQLVYFFSYAKIFYDDSSLKAISFLNKEYRNKSIGVVDVPMVSAFLKTEKRFQFIYLTGMPFLGKNPLLEKNLPDIIVLFPDRIKIIDEQEVLDKNYKLDKSFNKISVYTKWPFSQTIKK